MSALAFNRRRPPPLRSLAIGAAATVGLVVLGLFCGRLALSHYHKLALELGIGIPVVALLGAVIFRRPALGVIGIGVALAAIPSYSAHTVFHLTIHPALVLAAVTAVVLVLRATAGHRARLSPIDFCVALFMVTMCLSVAFGPRSWKEASAQLWVWLAAYLGGRMIAGNVRLGRIFARTVVICGAMLLPFSIVEAAGGGNPFFNLGTGTPATLWAHPDIRLGDSFRIETSFGHPIAFSMFLAVAIVFALLLISQATSRRERLFYTATLVALLVQEALTVSRAGWVVIGVSVLLLAAGRRRGSAERAARRAIVVGVGLLLALVVAIPSVAAVPLSLVGLQSDTADSTQLAGTAQYRSNLYNTAFNGGVASLFGNKPSKLANSVQLGNGSIDSEYLLLLDQWGGVATVSFLLIAVALVARSLRSEDDIWQTAFTVTAVGSMVALASVALITQQEYLVWLLIGLSAAPTPLPTRDPAAPGQAAPPAGRPAVTAPTDHERTNLDVVAASLRRRWWILVICPLIFGGGALVLSKRQPVKYTAATAVLFQVPNYDQVLFGSSVSGFSSYPARRAATYVALAKLPVVAQRTAALIPGVSAARVRSEVKIAEEGPSDMYTINVTDHNPRLAALIANTYARQFLQFRTETDRARIAALAAVINRQLAAMTPAQRSTRAGQRLQERSDKLALLNSLQSGGAELTSPADPPRSASSPHNAKTAKYGAVIGLVLGFMLLFWLGRRDRLVRDAASVEDAYGLPLLGTVTDEQAATLGAALTKRSAATADAFDLFRATLRYSQRDRQVHTLMVTSAGAREGRTTVALQLAIAEAMAGNDRVLLLEADLRRPTLAAALDMPRAPGLAELLSGKAHHADAIRQVSVGIGGERSPGGVQIAVLPAGAPPANPLELIEAGGMLELLEALEQQYELIVIDTPPLSVVPDALPLLAHVSGVVVAGRIGTTTRQSAQTLRDHLDQAGAPTLGVVATSVPAARTRRFGLELSRRPWLQLSQRWAARP